VDSLPIVDVGPLLAGGAGRDHVVAALDAACRDVGFVCVVGHGVAPELLGRLDGLAREFFARPDAEKAAIAMPLGGLAWRGWFPVGGELTSGRPDRKEGLYVGRELGRDHPHVVAGRPMHGPNLWPAEPAGLRAATLAWMDAMESVGQALLRGLALALGLDAGHFAREITADPTVLFRIFHYPPGDGDEWGVGEHTDYGLLTLLAQDDCGGLQVRARHGWIDVPPDPEVLVVNIGDMLDRMTGGRYRSTPHRVRNTSGRDRLSFPFFLDPSWDAVVEPLPLSGAAPPDDANARWDGASVHEWRGRYGDYLTRKVAKVFPDLVRTTGLR
jgi:isopenicillin N synthase-like dioxygenase